jgi:hypothetical protein
MIRELERMLQETVGTYFGVVFLLTWKGLGKPRKPIGIVCAPVEIGSNSRRLEAESTAGLVAALPCPSVHATC